MLQNEKMRAPKQIFISASASGHENGAHYLLNIFPPPVDNDGASVQSLSFY
jgi:hypothetical protein